LLTLPPGPIKTELSLRGGGCRADQLARFDRADRMAESIALRGLAAELIEFDGVRFHFHE
jgi:hypothetical protein